MIKSMQNTTKIRTSFQIKIKGPSKQSLKYYLEKRDFYACLSYNPKQKQCYWHQWDILHMPITIGILAQIALEKEGFCCSLNETFSTAIPVISFPSYIIHRKTARQLVGKLPERNLKLSFPE